MLKLSLLVLCFLIGTSLAKEVTRSKRQMNVYYMCGNYPNSFVSQYPCTTPGNGCGYNSCNGFSSTGILPNSFYYPSNNCNSGCSNLNCNQYNGMYVNNQYVAYSYGSNQYSPCASSCCGNNNNFFGGRVIAVPFGGFNNGFNFGNGLNIGSGVYPTGSLDNGPFSVPIGSGVYPNAINAGPTGQTITVGGPLGATGQTINVGGPLAKQ